MIAADIPAEELQDLAHSLLNARQYRVWYLRHFSDLTLQGMTDDLVAYSAYLKECSVEADDKGDEPRAAHFREQARLCVTRYGKSLSVHTLKKALLSALRILDKAILVEDESLDGEVPMGVYRECSPGKLSVDTTLQGAHKRLRFGIIVDHRLKLPFDPSKNPPKIVNIPKMF